MISQAKSMAAPYLKYLQREPDLLKQYGWTPAHPLLLASKGLTPKRERGSHDN